MNNKLVQEVFDWDEYWEDEEEYEVVGIDRLRLIDYSPLVSKYLIHEEKKQAVRNDYLH